MLIHSELFMNTVVVFLIFIMIYVVIITTLLSIDTIKDIIKRLKD